MQEQQLTTLEVFASLCHVLQGTEGQHAPDSRPEAKSLYPLFNHTETAVSHGQSVQTGMHIHEYPCTWRYLECMYTASDVF